MEQNKIAPRVTMILVITALLVWATFSSGIRLGQDLQGGTTLRFSLDIDGAKKAGLVDDQIANSKIVADTVTIISDRIDKYGLAEIQLTQYGENKFIVSLPAGAGSQVEGIIAVISQLGDLKFRIEVRPDSVYRSDAEDDGNEPPTRTKVWNGTDEEYYAFLQSETEVWKTARSRGEQYKPTRPEYMIVKNAKAERFHLIESNSGTVDFDGGILVNPTVGENPDTHRPVVLYDVKNQYQNDFGSWTEANMRLPMAIILNNQLFSAPIIQARLSKSVQISLGRDGSIKKTREEAKALATVLQTGSLKIQPVLEAKNVMGPSLAGQSRDRGILAVLVAFGLVLLFMLWYYRVSGIVANVALLLNLVLLVGFMAFFQAVLTLPGIAGIVLTVGMAVDANILISERIREERRGGRSLARAVAEGYDRALSAIVDANVTSIITAIFLYNFGSGAVKGFAVTLAIGLLVSMFTAIFVTRTIVDWMMKTGLMKELSSFGSGAPPKIKWLGLRRIFAPLSVAGIVFGIVMFMSTDRYTLYDIDFTGGYKMQAAFTQAVTPDEVHDRLKQEMDVEVAVTSFDAKGDKVTRNVKVHVGPYPDAQILSAGEGGRGVEINVQRLFQKSQNTDEEQTAAFREYMRRVLADRLMPDWEITPIARFNHVPKEGADPEKDPLTAYSGGLTGVLAFQDPDALLSADLLKSILETDMPFWADEDGRFRPYKPAEKSITRKVEVKPFPTESAGVAAFEFWFKSTTLGGAASENDVKVMRQRFAEYLGGKGLKARLALDLPEAKKSQVGASFGLSQPFPSEDAIGSTVAERLKDDAIVALLLSLIGIVIYIGFRFRSRSMGFAAVLCLFHDVAITLGIVALANSLGLVDAKINLAMVAAFLTLVGYSVNDTVVIFDRIRENRGKRPTIDEALINASINQVLSRTIRTTATFLLVCIALFAFNYGQRNVLEGFAFLLILGSVIGTYSTVAISTPLLIYLPWLWERVKHYAPKGSVLTNLLTNVFTMLLAPFVAVFWLLWALAFALVVFVVGLVLFVPWALRGGAEQELAAA